jgi:hypothetical protein
VSNKPPPTNKRQTGEAKKTQLRGVALNPPKEEEGGGDKLQHAIESHLSMLKLERTIHHAFAAAQDSFAASMLNISLSSSKKSLCRIYMKYMLITNSYNHYLFPK